MAIALSGEIKTLIDRPNFGHLATLMPDGSPHSARAKVTSSSPFARKKVGRKMQGASVRPVCPRRIKCYLRRLPAVSKNSRLRNILSADNLAVLYLLSWFDASRRQRYNFRVISAL